MNTWLNGVLSNGQQIDAGMIATFFKRHEKQNIAAGTKTIKVAISRWATCPQVEGRMVVPYGPRLFSTYGQRTFLNVAEMNVREGDAKHERLGGQSYA